MATDKVKKAKEALRLAQEEQARVIEEEISAIHAELSSIMGDGLNIEEWDEEDPCGRIQCYYDGQPFNMYDAGKSSVRIEFDIPYDEYRPTEYDHKTVVSYLNDIELEAELIRKTLKRFKVYQAAMKEKNE